jgi:hypothetical protein
MSALPLRITSLSVSSEGEPVARGKQNPEQVPRTRRDIAYFDVEIASLIAIRGCALVRTAKDGLSINTPRLDKDRFNRRVDIISSALRAAITLAAREAYGALGGRDLPEWADPLRSEVTEEGRAA